MAKLTAEEITADRLRRGLVVIKRGKRWRVYLQMVNGCPVHCMGFVAPKTVTALVDKQIACIDKDNRLHLTGKWGDMTERLTKAESRLAQVLSTQGRPWRQLTTGFKIDGDDRWHFFHNKTISSLIAKGYAESRYTSPSESGVRYFVRLTDKGRELIGNTAQGAKE
jgi:hypothetical protein